MADDEREAIGWRVDKRLSEAVRLMAEREGRKIERQAERVIAAGLVALGEGDPTAARDSER